MAGYTLEIECREDGSFVCTKEAEEAEGAEMAPEAPEAGGQTFNSPGEVIAWVQQQLAGKADAKAAWEAEAAGRDSSGYRQPGGTPAMTM